MSAQKAMRSVSSSKSRTWRPTLSRHLALKAAMP